MITFKGYPQDGGLYTGYDVVRDGQKIGFIDVCGIFLKDTDGVVLTVEEKYVIGQMCKRVHEMPSEYGCLGVGESPTDSLEDLIHRNHIRHDLD